jgi:glycogen operon protein
VASVNFVTCHDGFTLRDLVSYDRKHNEANGEDGRDGSDDNRSWNCGTEGPTEDRAINELRARQIRNFLVTLFCSQGVPMLTAGDEMGRTQDGNNNAYCQDNEVSWVDWAAAAEYPELLEFTCALARLRRQHPLFRRRRFFSGLPSAVPAGDADLQDIIWLAPSGRQMTDADWQARYARALAVFLNGDAISEPAAQGEKVRDSDFLLLFNAHSETVTFTLPGDRLNDTWEVVIDTAAPVAASSGSAAAQPATAQPATARPGAAGAGAAGPAASGSAGASPAASSARLTIGVTGRSVVVLRGVGAPAALAPPALSGRRAGI